MVQCDPRTHTKGENLVCPESIFHLSPNKIENANKQKTRKKPTQKQTNKPTSKIIRQKTHTKSMGFLFKKTHEKTQQKTTLLFDKMSRV